MLCIGDEGEERIVGRGGRGEGERGRGKGEGREGRGSEWCG